MGVETREPRGPPMAADAAHARDDPPKAKIFISYSRRDTAFVDRLEPALKARGFEPLIDRQDPIALRDWSKGIAPFEAWWKRIQALIEKADTIVFVLSPDSVASKVALAEINYGKSLNKRFAPIVCRKVDNKAVPEALRELQYILFDDSSRFDANADHLAAALQIDLDWIRKHSEYGETARRWANAGRAGRRGLLLRSPMLEEAERWIASRPRSAPAPTEETIALLGESRRAAIWRRRHLVALASAAVLVMVAVLTAWWQQNWLRERSYILRNVNALSALHEKALRPTDSFKECTDCPEMIVVPAGSFTMGLPPAEDNRFNLESPAHQVTIAKQFAVAKFELTFAEWDVCWAQDSCDHTDDDGFGRGQRPVIYVSWEEAKQYAAWLSRITDRTYRLLSEAEYEYATRGVTQPGMTTAYPWGDDIGKRNANCRDCGSDPWGGHQTAPVGQFPPNRFGLYDTVGNVWEWTEDCFHIGYQGAPTDGLPWSSGDCNQRVLRGGAWGDPADWIISASRNAAYRVTRTNHFGFRVARTLISP